jgi:hypothetical protein
MSELVDPTKIESIVGAARHPLRHLARAVSEEQKVYILHSQECLESGIDLRNCRYSLALDAGIDIELWVEDKPLHVFATIDGELVPCPRCELPYES